MKLAWKQIVVAFLVGALLGTAGSQWCAPFHGYGWGSEHSQKRMLDRFNSRLKLTPDQRQKVAAILEAKRSKMGALRAEVHPKFEEIRNSTRAEIRQLLTPEQQKKFDVMNAEHDARAKRFRDRWGSEEGNIKCKGVL